MIRLCVLLLASSLLLTENALAAIQHELVFQEEGVASWYGGFFHGRKTASGAVFDMHQLTAAHKSLPLNTMVRVTNLDNGKSVDVLLNDRGPYIGNRIIDLSRGAAERLGFKERGLAKVKIEYLPEASKAFAKTLKPKARERQKNSIRRLAVKRWKQTIKQAKEEEKLDSYYAEVAQG